MVFRFRGRPHVLCGVVLGCVGGEAVYGEPALVFFDPLLHDLRTMRGESVHEKREVSTALVAFQFLEIAETMTGTHRFLLHGEYQSRSCAVRTTQYRANDSAVLPPTCRTNARSLAALRPRVAHYRTIRESCFVEETKGCF